jgi:hypothetical protein
MDDRREADTEDEDFPLDEEKEQEQDEFEMAVGRRLEAEGKVNEERRVIVEPQEGQQMPERNEIPRLSLDASAIEEVKENEIKTGIGAEIQGEAEVKARVGEIINPEDNEKGTDDETGDFFASRKRD